LISEANVGRIVNLANNISANRGFSSVNHFEEIAKGALVKTKQDK